MFNMLTIIPAYRVQLVIIKNGVQNHITKKNTGLKFCNIMFYFSNYSLLLLRFAYHVCKFQMVHSKYVVFILIFLPILRDNHTINVEKKKLN